jgi:hypothetical protein
LALFGIIARQKLLSDERTYKLVLDMTNMAYSVVEPTATFLGKTYVDWIEDWTRWFFLPNADQNNSGSVVFLRGMSPSATKGEGVIMVGNDSLEISETQRVLLPIITATAVAELGETSQTLYELARSDIDNGDHPPAKENVKINTGNLQVDLEKYRFETRVLQLNIPSSPYGESLADYVVPAIKTRDTNLPCVTAGYFVLLKLGPGNYDIFSSVHGSRDQTGLYKASLLYHIVVEAERGGKGLQGAQVPIPLVSPQTLAKFKAALRKKLNDGEIDDEEFDRLVKHIR